MGYFHFLVLCWKSLSSKPAPAAVKDKQES